VIYPLLLKSDFGKLPPALKVFHAASGERRAAGIVEIRHDHRWIARLARFPAAGVNIPVRLHVTAGEHEEIWTRWFGNSMRRSIQWISGDLLVEKAGPIRIDFHVFADETGMRFESHTVTFWGIPVPLRAAAWARGDGASWEVEVTVQHVGSYRGRIAPEP
jgi:hypothetical protein